MSSAPICAADGTAAQAWAEVSSVATGRGVGGGYGRMVAVGPPTPAYCVFDGGGQALGGLVARGGQERRFLGGGGATPGGGRSRVGLVV